MRIQSFNQNNQHNQIGFKMQAHAVCGFHCPKGEPCARILLQMTKTFQDLTSRAGAWRDEGTMMIHMERIGNTFDFLFARLGTYVKAANLRRAGKEAEAQTFLDSFRMDEVNTLQLRMPIATNCPNSLIPAKNLMRNLPKEAFRVQSEV